MNIWIITASREWTDRPFLADTFYKYLPYANVVVHGGAPGGDMIADVWCRKRGIHVCRIDALWDRYKKPAGPLRNHIMCDLFPTATVLGLPLENSVGTWECLKYAESKGMKTIVVEREL